MLLSHQDPCCSGLVSQRKEIRKPASHSTGRRLQAAVIAATKGSPLFCKMCKGKGGKRGAPLLLHVKVLRYCISQLTLVPLNSCFDLSGQHLAGDRGQSIQAF